MISFEKDTCGGEARVRKRNRNESSEMIHRDVFESSSVSFPSEVTDPKTFSVFNEILSSVSFVSVTEANNKAETCVEKLMSENHNTTIVVHKLEVQSPV